MSTCRGCSRKQLEQRELRAGELDPPAAAADLARAAVELEVGEAHRPAGLGLRAADEGAQPRLELLQRERLDEIVVGAGVEPRHAVVDGVARGEHQHRRPVAGRAQPAADLQPVDAGHGDVEHDGVDDVLDEVVERGAAVAGRPHVVVVGGERALERLAHGGLVVDDEHLHAGSHSPASIVAATRAPAQVVGRVAVEHDDVGGEPGREPAAARLRPLEPGGRGGEGGERRVERQRLLGPPRGPVVERAQHRRAQPVERGQRLDRRVRAARDHRARVEQRAVGVGVADPVRPQPVGDVAVDVAWVNCTEAATPSCGEARDVVGVDALRVLDPRPQPAPVLARGRERVERVAVRAVADRVDGEREAVPRPRAGSAARAPPPT